jgi:Rrf2 family cysteine metabolism transcriptional repressor
MKLSLKVEYACRVLAQLGRLHGTNRLAHIGELAELEAVPQNYLVQILNELRNGGLILSRRGKQGGYLLAKPPEAISLRDIVAVMDKAMLEDSPAHQGQSGPLVAAAWSQVAAQFEASLSKLNVRHLMTRDAPDMYYI